MSLRPYVLVCLFYGLALSSSFAQCVNRTPLGSTVNVWDWRVENYEIVRRPAAGAPIATSITSPFFLPNNTLQPNTVNLALPQVKDYEPEDGWELIFYNLGTLSAPVAEPAFALYNRYIDDLS